MFEIVVVVIFVFVFNFVLILDILFMILFFCCFRFKFNLKVKVFFIFFKLECWSFVLLFFRLKLFVWFFKWIIFCLRLWYDFFFFWCFFWIVFILCWSLVICDKVEFKCSKVEDNWFKVDVCFFFKVLMLFWRDSNRFSFFLCLCLDVVCICLFVMKKSMENVKYLRSFLLFIFKFKCMIFIMCMVIYIDNICYFSFMVLFI